MPDDMEATYCMRLTRSSRLNLASIFHLPVWSRPPIGRAVRMPDRLHRLRKKVAKPISRSDLPEGSRYTERWCVQASSETISSCIKAHSLSGCESMHRQRA